MANRRGVNLITRYFSAKFSIPNPFLHSMCENLYPNFIRTQFKSLETLNPRKSIVSANFSTPFSFSSRNFCPNNRVDSTDDDEVEGEDEDEDDEDETEAAESDDDEEEHMRGKSDAEKANEAFEIGYQVIGPLQESDRVFKPYEPLFAIVQIGSHQFKVSNGDTIYSEKLKYCDVNDKLILNKVLMLGSKSQSTIGRPILPEAAVHAVVEEHALDAKVIIFKKKRRKNYRRTKGHRQELTRLRITDILGIEKPEPVPFLKTRKTAVKKTDKIAVAA